MLQQLQVYLQETKSDCARTRAQEKANRVSSRASRRVQKFHSLVEDYLRKEKDYIQFDDVMQESQFMSNLFSMKSCLLP